MGRQIADGAEQGAGFGERQARVAGRLQSQERQAAARAVAGNGGGSVA